MPRPRPAERNAAIAAAHAEGASVAALAERFYLGTNTVYNILRQASHPSPPRRPTPEEATLDAAILEHLRTSSRWSPLDSPEIRRMRATAHAVEVRLRALQAAGRIAFGGRPGRWWYVVEG